MVARIKYVCLILISASTLHVTAQQPATFINISNELVNDEVTSIIQDKKGFIWFGTRGGLHRFDGYEMKLLKNEFSKANNFLSQSIEVLQEGKQNTIWVGTKSGGLSSYNLATGSITNFINNHTANTEFNADYILSVLDTEGEKLLIGTWKGFQYLDKKTGKFTILNSTWKTFDIQPDEQNGYWLATNSGLRHLDPQMVNDHTYDFGKPGLNITSIVYDKELRSLWLGTWDNGLYLFNPKTGTYRNFRYEKNQDHTLSSNNTYRLLLDTKGILWVGTWGGGLNRFDRYKETFEKMDLGIPGLYTTDNEIILTIQEDPSGLLWIGTDGAGVFKHDLHEKKFKNIGYKANALRGSTHVLSVYVDPYQKLWLGTKGGDGILYSADWKNFSRLGLAGKKTTTGLTDVYESRSFLQDGPYLWIATSKGLVRVKNEGTAVGAGEVFEPDPADNASISGKKINALVKDHTGRIWVGTQENGLSCITGYTPQNKPRFRNYLPDYGQMGALQNERVSCLLVDSRKRLWVGTFKGLHLYQPATDQFQVFMQTGEPGLSLSNNTILCLAEDRFGNIWAGTQYGLNKISGINGEKPDITSYTTKESLPNDYIHAVIPDEAGNVWASTNKGIVRIGYPNQSIAVFDSRDGILSDKFSENASFKDPQNRFFFGGVQGLTYFEPDSITINPFVPPVYFTNLSINNKPYEFGKQKSDSAVLDRPFYETQNITLTYRENNFSIEFAALDYHAPDKNEYMYKLEGFNDDWVFAGNNRRVSFTNLKAGTYYLLVKATNSDKIWSEAPHKLKIKILPPPWKTWWAYTIYIILFLFLLWLTRYFGLRQVALKNQLMLTKLARQKENELSQFKERLFTNISHEFRTPLTLILGPLDDLLQRNKVEPAVGKSLRLIQKHSRRMLRMVNQLLDYQKAEAGSLKLTLQPGELVSFCREIFSGFTDEATRKNIRYTFHAPEKFISYDFDHNKLEIALFNILANAFKYTPGGESIHMEVGKDANGGCQITVKDTGKGIPENELPRIFDRFYRGKEDDAATILGTGIGLSFVKELITLHGGAITAQSDGQKGTAFILSLPPAPVTKTYFPVNGEPLPFNDQKNETPQNALAMTDVHEPLGTEQELPIILVVEDETDIQEYITDILSPSFKVITAMNGKEGLEKALETIPDLVVSDIMMPEMDGIELCRTLKSHKDTSHIPVILLTALSDMNHHVQGIREGADVYLPKPFNSQLLLVHIHNLINSRNNLKELYAKKVFLGTTNFEIKTFEEEFLHKVMKVVEENISNSNFTSDDLANLIYMSRSTFYRKLKAVTGMSGNEFIRTARLNYAVKLLESGRYSVTDAAFEAGFNDIKYFRKRFQEHFGVSPSDYKK